MSHLTYSQSPFTTALHAAIVAKIRSLKASGVVNMSLANLQQIVPAPSSSLHGAPRGTNAAYFYATDFRDVCRSPEIARFVIA